MNQTWENGKRPNFKPKFGPQKLFGGILPLLDVRHCCKLSLYTISRKTNEPILRKWQKTLILGSILPHSPQIRAANFFFKNLASLVTRYHGQLSSCTISDKTNDPILRKLSDGWTDGQTDESDFIGRCPTNIERPTWFRNVFQWKKIEVKIKDIVRFINSNGGHLFTGNIGIF